MQEFYLFKQVFGCEILQFFLKAFTHDIKQELKLISIYLNSSSVDGLNKLGFVDVRIAKFISNSQRLLERDFLSWEGLGSNHLNDFLGLAKGDLFEESYLFLEEPQYKTYLNSPSSEGIKLIENQFHFLR
jgi:hypothetical protein